MTNLELFDLTINSKKLTDGTIIYYKNNRYHRPSNEGPAVIHSNGGKEYFENGLRHRLDGPAIEWPDGSKYYFEYGNRHRLDGPACIWPDGTKEWYYNGKRHRLDGPAVIEKDGNEAYFIEGEYYSINNFIQKIPKEYAVLIRLQID